MKNETIDVLFDSIYQAAIKKIQSKLIQRPRFPCIYLLTKSHSGSTTNNKSMSVHMSDFQTALIGTRYTFIIPIICFKLFAILFKALVVVEPVMPFKIQQ